MTYEKESITKSFRISKAEPPIESAAAQALPREG
jgi:hypothetical protein